MCVDVCEWELGRWFVCLVLLFIVGQWCLTLPWVRFTWGAYAQDTTECYHSKPLKIGPRCLCFFCFFFFKHPKCSKQVTKVENQGLWQKIWNYQYIFKLILSINVLGVWFPALTCISCQNSGMKWCLVVCFFMCNRMGMEKVNCFPIVFLRSIWFLKGTKGLRCNNR